MIIYNTTFHIEEGIQDDFIEYIRQNVIPQATKSGLLISPRFSRIFGEHEDKGFSYALEFTTESIDKLEQWNKTESTAVTTPLIEKFKDKIVGFSTVMQTISLR
jgi:hypothetical protein